MNAIEGRVAPDALPVAEKRVSGGIAFDWIMTALCTWFLGGVVLDNWAHGHQQIIGTLETFFTPWHGVLYSGWLAVTGFLLAALIRNHRRGYPWRGALPPGYGLSFCGVLVFTWGGLADMVWHTFYGIEVGLDATYSPPHMVLGVGLVLALSGPLRAAWRRAPTRGWGAQLPMVVSLAYTLSMVGFFTLFAQPLVNPWAAVSRRLSSDELGRAIGMLSILLHSGILMGLLLPAVLRRPFPPGGLTVLFALNGILMAVGSWPEQPRLFLIGAMAVAGGAADVLLNRLRPSGQRLGALRLFAFAVPAALYMAHFLALKLTDGIWWSVHLWTGSIAVAGMVGWLMSYAFAPPVRQARTMFRADGLSESPTAGQLARRIGPGYR
jgi:hypothetical protein